MAQRCIIPRRLHCHTAKYSGSVADEPQGLACVARAPAPDRPHTATKILLHTIKGSCSVIRGAVFLLRLKQRLVLIGNRGIVEACDSYSIEASRRDCVYPMTLPRSWSSRLRFSSFLLGEAHGPLASHANMPVNTRGAHRFPSAPRDMVK